MAKLRIFLAQQRQLNETCTGARYKKNCSIIYLGNYNVRTCAGVHSSERIGFGVRKRNCSYMSGAENFLFHY